MNLLPDPNASSGPATLDVDGGGPGVGGGDAGVGGGDAGVGTCTPVGNDDFTCDGRDDDCDGAVDEDYAPAASSCGKGPCAASGQVLCRSGELFNDCEAGTPESDMDGPTQVAGVDDDCDGFVDEDTFCDTEPRPFGPGVHALPVVTTCRSVTIRLWGGGGAGGGVSGITPPAPGGRGGAGGYAESTLVLAEGDSLELHVGAGGTGCTGAGVVEGSDDFVGGDGGNLLGNSGKSGGDQLISGGGAGGKPNTGGEGGKGHYGGGGGGFGANGLGLPGSGGGGGSASALLRNSAAEVIAGGGGGGGGASNILVDFAGPGNAGGAGCSGIGDGEGAIGGGGGGGGGGLCVGDAVETVEGGDPFDGMILPMRGAEGGGGACLKGGEGHAIVTFHP